MGLEQISRIQLSTMDQRCSQGALVEGGANYNFGGREEISFSSTYFLLPVAAEDRGVLRNLLQDKPNLTKK